MSAEQEITAPLRKEAEKMKLNIRKLVVAAMLAALCCVATAVIKIPAPYAGYIHPGDGFVLLAGWVLSPLYAFLSAGIGSLLADIFAGYAVYLIGR